MTINKKYLSAFFILFIIEVLIALFVHDTIIRPHIGDVLVVILMYTFIRSFLKKSIRFLPIYLFVFSVLVETAQYFHIVNVLHLQNNRIASIIIGTSFDIQDILSYFAALVVLMIWESVERKLSSIY